MTARRIIEQIDVVRYLGVRKLASSVDLFFDAFFFELAEERFRDRVVPTASTTAHALSCRISASLCYTREPWSE
jgi:hypothetical protein